MSKQVKAIRNDISTFSEDVRALIAATADVAGEKVAEVRRRLTATLENAREIAGSAREKAVEGAKAADVVVREHPYHAIGIGFGIGALIGCLIACRCTSNNN